MLGEVLDADAHDSLTGDRAFEQVSSASDGTGRFLGGVGRERDEVRVGSVRNGPDNAPAGPDRVIER